MESLNSASRPVLVAGGAGFLGSHLCRRLLSEGNDVLCLDNFQTGQMRNLTDIGQHPGFSILEHDVIEPLPADITPRQIYNLACAASPAHYQSDPLHTFRTCVIGADNLLARAVRDGAQYLQASTSEVYGEPSVHPQPEHYRGSVNPLGIRSCYDEGKRGAESLCADYRRTFGINVKIARIFNTYGPCMALDDGRLVSNLMRQALAGQDMTIYGDGSQTRSLCFVSDLIEGLVQLMNSSDGLHEPVNLGNPVERTVLDVADRIRGLTDSTSDFVFLPLPGDDPTRRCPDISRARHHLRWEPVVDLEEGLELTMDYFADELAALSDAGRVA